MATVGRLVQRDHVDGRRLRDLAHVDAELPRSPAALGGAAVARVVDEDAAHQARGQPQELRAVAPVHAALVDQAQVHLVHQRSWLERVAAALAPDVAPREPSELLVHEGEHLAQRLLVAVRQVEEEPRRVPGPMRFHRRYG
jgi:hypothetical protein